MTAAQGAEDDDDEVRELFVVLLAFVAAAKSPHSSKEAALDAIEKLQARLP